MSKNRLFLFVLPLVIATAVTGIFVFKSTAQVSPDIVVSSAPDTKDPIVLTLISGMRKRESQIKSVRAEILKQSYFNRKNESISELPKDSQAAFEQPNSLTQFSLAADEQRMREDERRVVPENPYRYDIKSFDGSKLQDWSYGQSVAYESQADNVMQGRFGALNEPLQISLGAGMNNYSLIKQLEKHNPKFVGKQMIAGVETYKLESQKGSQLGFIGTWWIAPSKSYLILRFEGRALGTVAAAPPEWRHIRIVDNTTEKDGIWFPTISRSIAYATSKQSQKEEWLSLDRYFVSDLKVNEFIADQVFQLSLPMGTKVFGEQDQKYFVGGDTSEFEAQVRKTQPDDKYLSDVPFKGN